MQLETAQGKESSEESSSRGRRGVVEEEEPRMKELVHQPL